MEHQKCKKEVLAVRNQDSWRRRGEKGKRGMTEVLLVATIFLSAKHNPSYTPLGSTTSANARTAEEVLTQTNIPLLSVLPFVALLLQSEQYCVSKKTCCLQFKPAKTRWKARESK